MNESKVRRVVHLVDAMANGDHLWGKERVVALLMREQRASGAIEPALVTFSPGELGRALAAEGFSVTSLSGRRSHGFDRAIGTFGQYLEERPAAVIHSHGYRANIVARATRIAGRAPHMRLVSTCHGWIDADWKLRLYNIADRWTSVLSDVTTVPDAGMLKKFPPFVRRRHVLNAVPPREDVPGETPFVRPGGFVAGTLGRIVKDKGILELLEAARGFSAEDVVFTVAGAGKLTPHVEAAGGNVRYAGYFTRPDAYLRGLDVYVQASHTEGLSLSLLEAMRAGLAIVATDVGATRDAVTDGESALIVPPCEAAALRDAVRTLYDDPELRSRLGRAARERFEHDFHIRRQHQAYLELYLAGDRNA